MIDLRLPTRKNKCYIKITHGGLNHAVAKDSDGYVLPNCVGATRGAWIESGQDDSKLYSGNAGYYYAWTGDGFERQFEPVEGGIMVWRKGDTTSGHIEFVIGIDEDGVVTTLYSGAGQDTFATLIERKPPYLHGELVYQGCIVPNKDPKVGEDWNFIGSGYYADSTSAKRWDATKGECRIIEIDEYGDHKYKVKRKLFGGSNVWGWVNREDLERVKK